MLAKIRWILKVLLALLVVAAFHYNLPQRDIVRIQAQKFCAKIYRAGLVCFMRLRRVVRHKLRTVI